MAGLSWWHARELGTRSAEIRLGCRGDRGVLGHHMCISTTCFSFIQMERSLGLLHGAATRLQCLRRASKSEASRHKTVFSLTRFLLCHP